LERATEKGTIEKKKKEKKTGYLLIQGARERRKEGEKISGRKNGHKKKKY